jgi:uncharacterized protein (DUF1501 family)
MSSSRRQFMIGCSAAIAAMSGSRLVNLAWGGDGGAAAAGPNDEILVVVFLRGGMDGLQFCGPVDDANYVAARPANLRVADAGEEAGVAIGNGPAGFDFRLHKNAAPLKELYDGKRLAIVHACGLTDGTRSHFDAMDLMERATVEGPRRNLSSGWLSRHLALTGAAGLLPAISGNASAANSLLGYGAATAIPDVDQFRFYGSPEQKEALAALYAGDHPLAAAGRGTLMAVDAVQGKVRPPGTVGDPPPYQPENGAAYPDGAFANSLRTVARLVKMDLGLRVATIDFGGWDTHEAQTYHFPLLIGQLAQGLVAFYNDLHHYHERLSVVVMSEFGRRLKANLSAGTDHGHGNAMLALGKHVNGGRVYGTWPGLATEQLDSRADLAVTTDYRAVLAELLTKRLRTPDIEKVLPGLKPVPSLGVFAADATASA